MKTMLRIGLAALSIANIGPAFAGEGGDVAANSFFTSLPGVIAQPPVQNAPPATAQNGKSVRAHVMDPRSGTSSSAG